MKKGVQFLTILLVILILPTFLALEIIPSKDSFQPEELFQVQITGNFLTLTEDNVFIYQEGKVHPEPTLKGLTKQNNVYYFYAVLPSVEGDYSFRIENAEYLERGKIKTDPINIPINSSFKDESDLYINPGFIIANDELSIKVKSLFGNTDITATFELTGEEKTLSIIEQTENTLNFNLPEAPPQMSKIIINNYEIPIFLIKDFNPQIRNLEFIPHLIEGTITPNNDYQFSVLIRNPTNNNLENIVLTSELNTVFSPSTIEILEPNQTIFVNLTITIEEIEEPISSNIIATSNNEQFLLPVEFIITDNETEVEVIDATIPIGTTSSNTGSGSGPLSCAQLGEICTGNQACSAETVESREGPCCIGICVAEESSLSSTITGIVLILLLIGLIAYVVRKARKNKAGKSSNDILKDKEEKYKKRIEGKKVDGKLDNI